MTTEYSPFAPPTSGDVPAAAPPPGVPMLPPSTPPPAAGAPPPPPPPLAPATPTPTPKRSRAAFVALAGLAAATVAGAAWFALSNTDDASSVKEPATDNQLDIAPQDVSNPIVVPIDDASEVMTQVDDNSSEAEALDLLGLDETGNIVAAGHRFTWSDGSGATATTTVDAATGDYAFESSDGFTYRRIDGTTYAGRNGVAWTEVDDGTGLDSVQRLGLDGPVTIDQVIDPLIDGYSSSVTNQRGDGTSAVSAEIDSHGLWNDHSLARLTWLAQIGIPNSEADVGPGSIIVVDASVGTDGRTVETLTVTTPTFTSTYVLDEVFETAPVIDLPEL